MFIAGAYRYNGNKECPQSLNSTVSLMAQALLHRNKHCYYTEDGNICLVSNNEQKEFSDLIVVYSGQIFNIDELKTKLSLAADSSCEAALKAAYKRWDCDFVNHLDGEFALALYDKSNHKLILGRDRAGLKPLFYYYDDALILFASEIKALLEAKKERKINAASLHSAILFSSVYSREHLIEGIYELRAGHILIMDFQGKTPALHKYWDRVFNIASRPFPYYEREFKRLISMAVKKRLPSNGAKVGISTSGGIDSTLVLALVKELYAGPIETYTAIAEGDLDTEYREARLGARNFHTKHQEIFVNADEAIQNFPKIIWHTGEFSMQYQIIGAALQTYFTAKLAAQCGCNCIFTGNGVEHNFDGNFPQRHLYRSYHDSKKIPKVIQDKLMLLLPEKVRWALKRKYSYLWTPEEMNNIEESYILRNTPWYTESRLKSFYSESMKNAVGTYNAKNILSEYLKECTAQDYFNKLLYIDFKTWNSRRNLVINERLFGAFGIQVQIPFLDIDVIQFSSAMPVAIKHSFKDSKYFIKKIYKNAGIFPPHVFRKGKRDSILRFNYFKGPALEVMLHFVSQLKKRNLFKESFIESVLSASKDQKGGRERDYLPGLFNLELWLRIFIDHPNITDENLTLDYLAQ
jgi:asparagine synthase (glutamine-hydrolysing)